MTKISAELFPEAWVQPQCKQFASEEFERPHSTELANEGHSRLSFLLLFLQHALVTTLTGYMASHCYFILSQFWKCCFLNFLTPTEFVVFFLPVLTLSLYWKCPLSRSWLLSPCWPCSHCGTFLWLSVCLIKDHEKASEHDSRRAVTSEEHGFSCSKAVLACHFFSSISR